MAVLLPIGLDETACGVVVLKLVTTFRVVVLAPVTAFRVVVLATVTAKMSIS